MRLATMLVRLLPAAAFGAEPDPAVPTGFDWELLLKALGFVGADR